MQLSVYIYFFGIFLLFFIKHFVFLSFSFLFLMKHQFQEQNINQLQTGIGDKKLSVEIMANTKYIVGLPFPDSQQEFN